MKKKYIQQRSRLFIGLLSLNILSACGNARTGLAMDRSRKNNDVEARGSNKNNSSTSWKETGKKVACGALGAVGGAAATVVYNYMKGSNCPTTSHAAVPGHGPNMSYDPFSK